MSTIGLIAGGGRFPLLLAESARRAGHRVVATGFVRQTLPELEQAVDALTWVKLGEFGKIAAALEQIEQGKPGKRRILRFDVVFHALEPIQSIGAQASGRRDQHRHAGIEHIGAWRLQCLLE